MAIPAEIPQQVEAIMREHLLRAFPDAIAFDPILVEPMIGWQGDENLHITVVYDGDYSILDPGKLNEISVAMLPQLEAIGFHNWPVESYVEKSEYDEWNSLSEEERWAELMGIDPEEAATHELGASD